MTRSDSMEEEHPLPIGGRVGDYRLERVIGRGGMGIVYEARHRTKGGRVAIKVMNGIRLGGRLARRFERESAIAARVQHPHVVRLIDAGASDGHSYLVLEFLEGETFAALLGRESRLELERLVQVFLPVLSAVAAIHDAGIVHRDLKLANVMLARRAGRVDPVLLDFGISKADAIPVDDSSLTQTNAVVGTLSYLSPEQTLNAKAVSVLSDQYALGVMLYEAATGRRPFTGASQYELMHAILHARLEPPSAHVPILPRAFDDIVNRAMNRDVVARFPDVRALGQRLLELGTVETRARWSEEFATSPLVAAPNADPTEIDEYRTLKPVSRRDRAERRRPLPLAFIVVVATASFGVLALATKGSENPPVPPSTRPDPPQDQASSAVTSGARATEPTLRAEATEASARGQPQEPVAPPLARATPKLAERGAENPIERRPSRRPAPSRVTESADTRRETTGPKFAAEPDEDDALDPFAPLRR